MALAHPDAPTMPPEALTVRPASANDADAWIVMRTLLWPESPEDHPREIEAYFAAPPARWTCLVVEDAMHRVIGFAEVGLRDYAEHCNSSPVGYLEGVWVTEAARSSGAGRALVEAGEAWARSLGCTEMASDRDIDDEGSGLFHRAVGFEETNRIVCYRKDI